MITKFRNSFKTWMLVVQKTITGNNFCCAKKRKATAKNENENENENERKQGMEGREGPEKGGSGTMEGLRFQLVSDIHLEFKGTLQKLPLIPVNSPILCLLGKVPFFQC